MVCLGYLFIALMVGLMFRSITVTVQAQLTLAIGFMVLLSKRKRVKHKIVALIIISL